MVCFRKTVLRHGKREVDRVIHIVFIFLSYRASFCEIKKKMGNSFDMRIKNGKKSKASKVGLDIMVRIPLVAKFATEMSNYWLLLIKKSWHLKGCWF